MLMFVKMHTVKKICFVFEFDLDIVLYFRFESLDVFMDSFCIIFKERFWILI